MSDTQPTPPFDFSGQWKLRDGSRWWIVRPIDPLLAVAGVSWTTSQDTGIHYWDKYGKSTTSSRFDLVERRPPTQGTLFVEGRKPGATPKVGAKIKARAKIKKSRDQNVEPR